MCVFVVFLDGNCAVPFRVSGGLTGGILSVAKCDVFCTCDGYAGKRGAGG